MSNGLLGTGTVGHVDSWAVAPPKRKSGGRVTPKGTRPSDRSAGPAAKRSSGGDSGTGSDDEYATGRYTAPIPASMRESPPWIPALMLGLLILGAILIILRNLVFTGNNWLTLLGLASILGGLYTATKWR